MKWQEAWYKYSSHASLRVHDGKYIDKSKILFFKLSEPEQLEVAYFWEKNIDDINNFYGGSGTTKKEVRIIASQLESKFKTIVDRERQIRLTDKILIKRNVFSSFIGVYKKGLERIDDNLLDPVGYISKQALLASIFSKVARGEFAEAYDICLSWMFVTTLLEGILGLSAKTAWMLELLFTCEELH